MLEKDITIDVLRNITKFYSGLEKGQKATSIAMAKRKYVEMVNKLNEVLGEDKAQKEIERLQKVYPNNYVRQAAEVNSRIKEK